MLPFVISKPQWVKWSFWSIVKGKRAMSSVCYWGFKIWIFDYIDKIIWQIYCVFIGTYLDIHYIFTLSSFGPFHYILREAVMSSCYFLPGRGQNCLPQHSAKWQSSVYSSGSVIIIRLLLRQASWLRELLRKRRAMPATNSTLLR